MQIVERNLQMCNDQSNTFSVGQFIDTPIVASQLDYQEVPILPHSTVYCDIPYKNTHGYSKNKSNPFDYERFYAWADSRDFPVFVSEYNMPSEFKPIARKIRIGTMAKDCNKEICKEQIFVQKRFADKYQMDLFGFEETFPIS